MRKLNKYLVFLKEQGITETLAYARFYALETIYNKSRPPEVPSYSRYRKLLAGLSGLEIGGPSVFFQERLPIYQVMKLVDGANFSSKTVWQGNIEEGKNYHYYKKKTGYLYICDTVNMSVIPSKKYDICLSCNVLEHIANPLKAISEWLRVTKDNGLLLLVVPKKEANFDHNRPITSFEHLKNDYDNSVGENDTSHLKEILQLNDLSLYPLAKTPEEFKLLAMDNFQNRTQHQHVFDLHLLSKTFRYLNLEILRYDIITTDYIVLGKKRSNLLLEPKN